MNNARYRRLCAAIASEPLPRALIDLEALESNVDRIAAKVRLRKKRLRIASKSIRCAPLMRRIMERHQDVFSGVMSYAVAEAEYLASAGFDDLLIAYPSARPQDAERLALLNRSHTAAIVVDCPEHLGVLASAARAKDSQIPVIIEADMSYRALAGRIHLGVRRSPLHTAEDVISLARQVQQTNGLRLRGVMAYEAQIAGVTDASPFAPLLNHPKRLIKRLSRPDVEKTRARIAAALGPLEVFNGGGTGSLHWASQESALTEVTAGSGFLGSHLFDYYRAFDVEPAALFALQVVRRPGEELITCHGGGYVASGQSGVDRLPRPYLPKGLTLLPLEGAGEVQTPLTVPKDVQLSLGDPVFFRHAKSGELAEHFQEYLLVRGETIEARAPTYRGEGRCFL